MTRQEKAQRIINAGMIIIHECNLSDTEPADDSRIYYLSDDELDMMLQEMQEMVDA